MTKESRSLNDEGASRSSFVIRHSPQRRHRFALLPPAGEVPGIRESLALRGLGRLHDTVATFEENTLPIRLIEKCQPIPVWPHTGVLLDEIVLAHLKQTGHGGDILVRDPDRAGPAAAIRAALAFIVNLLVHTVGRSIKWAAKIATEPANVKTVRSHGTVAQQANPNSSVP